MKSLFSLFALLSMGSLYAAGGTTATVSASMYVQQTTSLTVSAPLTFVAMTAHSIIGSNIKSSNGPITITSIVSGSTNNGQNVTLSWGPTAPVSSGGSSTSYAALQGTQGSSNYIPFTWYYGTTTATIAIPANNTKIISIAHPANDTVTCVLDAMLLSGQNVGPTDYYVHNATLISNTGV